MYGANRDDSSSILQPIGSHSSSNAEQDEADYRTISDPGIHQYLHQQQGKRAFYGQGNNLSSSFQSESDEESLNGGDIEQF